MKDITEESPLADVINSEGCTKKPGRKGRKKKHIFRGDPNYYNIQNNLLEKKDGFGHQGSDNENEATTCNTDNIEIAGGEVQGGLIANPRPSADGFGLPNSQTDMKILDN